MLLQHLYSITGHTFSVISGLEVLVDLIVPDLQNIRTIEAIAFIIIITHDTSLYFDSKFNSVNLL